MTMIMIMITMTISRRAATFCLTVGRIPRPHLVYGREHGRVCWEADNSGLMAMALLVLPESVGIGETPESRTRYVRAAVMVMVRVVAELIQDRTFARQCDARGSNRRARNDTTKPDARAGDGRAST